MATQIGLFLCGKSRSGGQPSVFSTPDNLLLQDEPGLSALEVEEMISDFCSLHYFLYPVVLSSCPLRDSASQPVGSRTAP